MRIYRLLYVAAFVFAGLGVLAKDAIPAKPSPARLVNDYAKLLHGSEGQMLEAKLAKFATETGTQIVVVIVDDFGGYDKADFAVKVGESWGVGQKGSNNGAVIVLKPKIGSQRGEVHISTGYGLEALIPDITAKQIVENEMIPNFRKNDYYQGLDAAISIMMGLALKDFPASKYAEKKKEKIPWGALVAVIIIAFFVFGIGAWKITSYARTHNMTWLAAWMLMSSANSSHRGSYGNFSRGSGGFGGFGGGSFGGGGAGGSW